MSKLRLLLGQRIVKLRTILTFPAFCAIAKIIWGLALLNPYVSTFEENRGYGAIQRIFFMLNTEQSETTWGIVLIILGSLHLYTTVSPYSTARFVADHISIGFWIFLGVAFLMYDLSLITPYFYFYIAIYEFFYIRKEADKWLQESLY